MLAKKFRGVYVPALSLKLNGGDTPNIKAFGAKDVDQIVVMLLNQEEESSGALPVPYTVWLTNSSIVNNNALEVKMGAGVSSKYSSPPQGELGPESTVMLVFDSNGVLLERHVYSLDDQAPTVYMCTTDPANC
jgi:hypothetical protein